MSATTKETAAGVGSVSVGSIDDNRTLTVTVEGSEFAPKVPRGSVVRVEPTDGIKGGGGTYVVEVAGHQMLQYVQRKPGRRLRLSGHNTDHEDVVIQNDDEEGWTTLDGTPVEFDVVGRLAEIEEVPRHR